MGSLISRVMVVRAGVCAGLALGAGTLGPMAWAASPAAPAAPAGPPAAVAAPAPAPAAAAAPSASGLMWSYRADETGPEGWGDLKLEFISCKMGREKRRFQTPIDIQNPIRANLPQLGLSYRAVGAELLNNGHTIQVDMTTGASLTVPQGTFALRYLHFRSPGEERIEGRQFPMSIHLVHRNEVGKLAIIAVMVNEGRENPALARLFAQMPKQVGERMLLPAPLNPAELLPVRKSYYTFMGSLNHPPCSEGVRWYVLQEPIEASRAQIAIFRSYYWVNARPLQPLNGRRIELSP